MNETNKDEDPKTDDDAMEEADDSKEMDTAKTCKIVNKDGLIIIEAESFDLKGSWRVVEDTKAFGGKYIEYFGANSYQSYTAAAPHEITVKFTIDS